MKPTQSTPTAPAVAHTPTPSDLLFEYRTSVRVHTLSTGSTETAAAKGMLQIEDKILAMLSAESTPLTDAAEHHGDDAPSSFSVTAEFARTLELRCNSLMEDVEILRKSRDEWRGCAERTDAKMLHEQADHNKTVDRLLEARTCIATLTAQNAALVAALEVIVKEADELAARHRSDIAVHDPIACLAIFAKRALAQARNP